MIGCLLNQGKNGTSFQKDLVCLVAEMIKTTRSLTACNVALRKQLRAGDHYNILLAFPGFPFCS